MTAKDRFTHHCLLFCQRCEFPAVYPAVALVGEVDYDMLFAEVSTSIADFMAVEQSQISLELQRKRVAHFYYRGTLVIRSQSVSEGFFFA